MRPNLRNAGVVYKPPVEKKKLEEQKKQREEEEKNNHAIKMMREKLEIDERSKGIKKATAVPKFAPVEYSTFNDK